MLQARRPLCAADRPCHTMQVSLQPCLACPLLPPVPPAAHQGVHLPVLCMQAKERPSLWAGLQGILCSTHHCSPGRMVRQRPECSHILGLTRSVMRHVSCVLLHSLLLLNINNVCLPTSALPHSLAVWLSHPAAVVIASLQQLQPAETMGLS
jgi:predicted anti-sigma-YlaC factor YlaD